MAHKMRAARATAKRGDIFTPATEAMFRRLIRPPMTKGADAAENKAIVKEDAPAAGEVPFKVNGGVPERGAAVDRAAGRAEGAAAAARRTCSTGSSANT